MLVVLLFLEKGNLSASRRTQKDSVREGERKVSEQLSQKKKQLSRNPSCLLVYPSVCRPNCCAVCFAPLSGELPRAADLGMDQKMKADYLPGGREKRMGLVESHLVI